MMLACDMAIGALDCANAVRDGVQGQILGERRTVIDAVRCAECSFPLKDMVDA